MEQTLTFWEAYWWCVLGVVISIAVPILSSYLPEGKVLGVAFNERTASSGLAGFFGVARPYLAMGALSLLVSVLIVAGLTTTPADWKTALLAGFAWQSTIQQFKG